MTITLDDEVLAFVDISAREREDSNRSGFINRILAEERRRQLETDLEAAYKRDAADAAWREEADTWDSTVGDGLNA